MTIITHQEKTKQITAWLEQGEIHWETRLPNGVIHTHMPIITKGTVATSPASIKMSPTQHLIIWGAEYREGYAIEATVITNDNNVLPYVSLSHNNNGFDSSFAFTSHDNKVMLAWINTDQAVESMQISYNDKSFVIENQQEYDFALPIENAQLRIAASHEGRFTLFFQTLDDNEHYSWAIKSHNQEALIKSDFDLGMASWAISHDGDITGVAEILNEGLEDKLFVINLDSEGLQQHKIVFTPQEVIEAQWPQITAGTNEGNITFSARLQDNQYQTYYNEYNLKNIEDPNIHSFKPFGAITDTPIETDELAIISDNLVANIMSELSNNEHLADLGFVLQTLSENYGQFDDFIHVDYNSDASTRIVQVDISALDDIPLEKLHETFVLNSYNTSQYVLDFFDYIQTDFS